ncbi:hypothetical protein Sjap_010158 [Stephania japonica]|uniref:Uncharacterized protein n=1 Tax=Stephania japonica TaxID=461633 RepID=A0AAP0P6V7_9MAGN
MESSKKKITAKVLEVSQVAPSPSSTVSEASLPLTSFDLPLLLRTPPEHLLFYEVPNLQVTQFMNSALPQIKYSLSQTLQYFYPLAGKLIWSQDYNQPIIKYVYGDSVTLNVVESNASFNHLSGYHARYAEEFQHLSPQLTTIDSCSSNKQSDKTKAVPVLALQITLFENAGYCLGITQLHCVVDGRSAAMFRNLWAFFSQSRNASPSLPDQSLVPSFNRSVINDEEIGLRKLYSQRLVEFIQSKSMSEQDCNNWLSLSLNLKIPPNQVAVSFLLTSTDVARLRKLWVSMAQSPNNERHPSKFVLACAYLWVCLAKASKNSTQDHDEEISSIAFAADCRSRLDPPVPTTYFGNCVMLVKASAKRSDIVGEDGIVIAVNSVMKETRGLCNVLVKNTERGLNFLLSGPLRIDVIAGSTLFGYYKLDFGWGRPKKVELLSTARTGAIFFADCRNGDDGGVEMSLVRGKDEAEAFGRAFRSGLNDLVIK